MTPQPPGSLLTLPAGVVERILHLLPISSIKPLRECNSSLRDVCAGILFRRVVFQASFFGRGLERSKSAEILNSKDGVPRLLLEHTREVVVYGDPPKEFDMDKINLLHGFLSKLHLTTLDYNLPFKITTPLPSLQNLTFTSQTLTITNFLKALPPPPITSLKLNDPGSFASFPPVYLQNLKSLVITPSPTPTPKKLSFKPFRKAEETIYDHLRRHEIYPQILKTCSQSINLLVFLISYPSPSETTLTHLEITLPPAHADETADFINPLWDLYKKSTLETG
ncbi:hypothetical protein TWF481_011087 [Arthrobotrys musiformis]|uniref:F-box domain-containing protein n=1 Tax=Arthrobotrys musiformis TaxID=47236 RepID=A0AAV9VYQ9_9PEZI